MMPGLTEVRRRIGDYLDHPVPAHADLVTTLDEVLLKAEADAAALKRIREAMMWGLRDGKSTVDILARVEHTLRERGIE